MARKKIIIGSVTLILLIVALWIRNAIFYTPPQEAAVKKLLIELYTVPDHEFYLTVLQTNPNELIEYVSSPYKAFLTDEALHKFVSNSFPVLFDKSASHLNCLFRVKDISLSLNGAQLKDEWQYTYEVTLEAYDDQSGKHKTSKQAGLIGVKKDQEAFKVNLIKIQSMDILKAFEPEFALEEDQLKKSQP